MEKQGSCQCGKVKYQICGEPIILYRCHCTECQKQAGSGFGMSMWVKNKDFKITEGALKQFIRIADSGGKIVCFFCGAILASCQQFLELGGPLHYRIGVFSHGESISALSAISPSG